MTGDVPGLLLRDVELRGLGRRDCRIRGGLIAEIGRGLRARPDELVIAGLAGALLPGLADHHLHLAAMAASEHSLDLSSFSRQAAARELALAPADDDGWIRVVGYDDEAHGYLDCKVLDEWRPKVPVRVQHRAGALWVVNSVGLERLGAATAGHPGIERDASGRLTGRLWRADAWLREAAGTRAPSLRLIGERLAALGVTHLSDATPNTGAAGLVIAAVYSGDLAQHVQLMAPGVDPISHARVTVGPVKLIVADHSLPALDQLADQMSQAHGTGRPVAVHCVTRAALVLTIAALDQSGHLEGDRIEHCAVADEALADALAARGLRVVTQPTLITRRGDDYSARVDPEDRADLWPYATLLRAGVRVAPSSDAPYGDPDPWSCIRAATQRLTSSGRVLGPQERVSPEAALDGMLSPLAAPGGPVRTVTAGQPADLVLLDRPLADALRAPDSDNVRVTLIGGEVRYSAEPLA